VTALFFSLPVWRVAKPGVFLRSLAFDAIVARRRKIQTSHEKNFIFRAGTIALWHAMGI
jgi:hypothetical protein